MPADDYADPKKVREKKEKEDKVVQFAAVVHMEDEIPLKIAIHYLACLLHKYILFVFHCSKYPMHINTQVDMYTRFLASVCPTLFYSMFPQSSPHGR